MAPTTIIRPPYAPPTVRDDYDVKEEFSSFDGSNSSKCAFFKLRPRQRDWMYHVTSPQELLLQLVSLENRLSRPEQSGNSGSGQDFMELILSLSRRNGDSSDDGGDDDSGPEDFFS